MYRPVREAKLNEWSLIIASSRAMAVATRSFSVVLKHLSQRKASVPKRHRS